MYDEWGLEREEDALEEDDVGDSCCIRTRVVEVGSDCIWRVHGGV